MALALGSIPPLWAVISAYIGGIVFVVGWIWIVITAFRESWLQGWLSIFVPPYAIYYGVKRWSSAKKPFVIASVGVVLLIVGIVAGFFLMSEVKEISFGDGWLISRNVTKVIREFMEAGKARNISAAYACWSPESATEEEIGEFIERSYDEVFNEVFEGYGRFGEGGSVGFRYSESGSNAIVYCHCESSIIYHGRIKVLPFEAWLVKENDIWKLTYFQIERPSSFLFSVGINRSFYLDRP